VQVFQINYVVSWGSPGKREEPVVVDLDYVLDGPVAQAPMPLPHSLVLQLQVNHHQTPTAASATAA
jgi:hypothetical protein